MGRSSRPGVVGVGRLVLCQEKSEVGDHTVPWGFAITLRASWPEVAH